MKRVKLHIAAFISWHHKGALQFYNDEHDMSDIQIKKPRKPRRRKTDKNDVYRQRVIEWEVSLPHDVDIKSQDNNMTQVYYSKCLLSVYTKKIHECRFIHERSCIFQEDNDLNHDTRSAVNNIRTHKAVN